MRGRDWAKGLVFGVGLLLLDLAIATLVIAVYSWVVDPGHPQAYYEALAPRIAGWSSRVAGPLLFLLAAWRLGRRHPERDPWAFAGALFLGYLIADLAMLAFLGPVTLEFALTMALKLAGALAGAWLATRGRSRI